MSKIRKSIFSEIFDGPESIFGRIFSESEDTVADAAPTPASASTPLIVTRIRLTDAHMVALASGLTLEFQVAGNTTRLVPPTKDSDGSHT